MSYIFNTDAAAQKLRSEALKAPRSASAASKQRVEKNAEFFYRYCMDNRYHTATQQYNADSLQSRAFHLARELEYIYTEQLREQYAPNNALRLWAVDSRPGAGAKSHTVRRIAHRGEARYYRGNAADRGHTDVERTEKQFPVEPIVTSIQFDFWEVLSSGFAGSGLETELRLAAMQTVMDFKNEKTITGEAGLGIRGILNYDWLPKASSPVVFDYGTDPDVMLQELHRLASLNNQFSKQVYSPNRLIVGTRIYDVLSQTKRSATTDQTVLQAFLQDNAYVNTVEAIHEFDGRGPSGEDVMFFDRANDMRSVANVIPTPFSMLPVQETGFDFEIPCYMLDGGIVMRDPLNNLLVYSARP